MIGARLNHGVHQVGLAMHRAQRTAVLQQHAVIVAFDTTGRRLRIHQDRNNDGAMQADETVEHVALEDGMLFGRGPATALPMGSGPVTFVKTQSGLPAITFNGSGSAGEGGGFYLTSSRALRTARFSGDSHAYTISRVTGRVFEFQFADGNWRRKFP
jgi:hypothetical protein